VRLFDSINTSQAATDFDARALHDGARLGYYLAVSLPEKLYGKA
jgi:hypothetical protein